ncbi:MAG TPA: NAD(P)/FAD-dependent oxidoreductase [Stellaceae bacterium]|nr:NAD(P)/FAD-dependent oxidoreductase [Stellaceae bacterium]
MTDDYVDVLIVGAGLSGIGAACHLQRRCPGKSFLLLEGRERMGGTWDLFRYPGIRSDSDMYTLGYSFRPWTEAKAIADGPSILRYIKATARDFGIESKIRFQHRALSAAWSSEAAQWTVEARNEATRETVRIRCGFLFMCSGYYNYAQGYLPEFPGIARFRGPVIHPQKWTEDIDYAGKRVIVIGSGATAVTLVPEMAKKAEHVTMLQRSPTYIVSRPSEDRIAHRLRRYLPERLAYAVTRWKNVLLGMYFYRLTRRKPAAIKAWIINQVRQELGPDYDVGTNFTPRYNPWDQRLCLVPDGDLFNVLKAGRASIVTAEIESFTETGLKLASGVTLAADLVVTATGLDILVLGGVALTVDGQPVNLAKTFSYKGIMYSDVPNLASAFGYTNASWTLKCDLACDYVCRLLNTMEKKGLRQCTPRNHDPDLAAAPWIDFSSGYIQRAIAKFPKQGSRAPWKLYQNYVRDLMSFRYGVLEDGAMIFSNPVIADRISALPRAQ